MFTSRAEYRLLLRQDNADLRLSKIGYDVGLLPKRNIDILNRKVQLIDKELSRLSNTRFGTETMNRILSRPKTSYADLPSRDDALSEEIVRQVEIAVKYAGYIQRQEMDVYKFKNLEGKQIPHDFDYSIVPSLRMEARQKLARIRPTTLGQASRISGVSPADIGIVTIWLKRGGTSSRETIHPSTHP